VSDTSASAEAGWNRYYVKSSGLLERDLSVYRDESLEDRMFSIVGDKKGAEISDADGNVVMTVVVTKGFLSKVEYTNADGTSAGHLTTNSVFSKKAMELTRGGGAEWTVVKSGRLKQFYSVLENDVPIAKMDLQTLALKRTYPLDIAESVDLPLAMGLVWAINFAHLRRVSGAGAAAG